MQPKKNYIALLLTLLFAACQQTSEPNQTANEIPGKNLLQYAKRFSLQKTGNTFLVSVRGSDTHKQSGTTFAVAADTNGLRTRYPGAFVVQSPCEKIVALSSIYASMFYELGELGHVVAIDNADYITNSEILAAHRNGRLTEVARGPEPDLEKIIALKPDALFTFGMAQGNAVDKRLVQSGVPVAVSFDHLEENPLARAEWLKFYAVFVGRYEKADSIFTEVEKDYLQLKKLAAEPVSKPTVFSDIKYSEFWYMPGGKSYLARLIEDAGGNYLWRSNLDFGSQPLSFEQVYAKARQADVWINPSSLRSLNELEAFDKRYTGFEAFKKGKVYNNTLHVNTHGYSNYWESGMIHPNRILSDLIRIFHPELEEKIGKHWNYYQQLK